MKLVALEARPEPHHRPCRRLRPGGRCQRPRRRIDVSCAAEPVREIRRIRPSSADSCKTVVRNCGLDACIFAGGGERGGGAAAARSIVGRSRYVVAGGSPGPVILINRAGQKGAGYAGRAMSARLRSRRRKRISSGHAEVRVGYRASCTLRETLRADNRATKYCSI